jgi:flagellar biosynthetic protein FliR
VDPWSGSIEVLAQQHALACMRLLPLVVLPTLSPFSFAPVMARSALLAMLGGLLVAVSWTQTSTPVLLDAVGFLSGLLSEAMIGLAFAFAFYLPIAAINAMARVIDMQMGLSAAALLFPNLSAEAEAPISAILTLLAQALFFTLDLHLEALALVAASLSISPLGLSGLPVGPGVLAQMLGAQFSLALLLVAPTMTALFVVDVATAYATRAMPQANVYFLMLPLKVFLGMLLLAASLAAAPDYVRRMFDTARAGLGG